MTGEGQAQLEDTQSLLVLQLVKALKDRNIGETRIAAKSLKHLIDQYPDSVEAHRAYIETKTMLKEVQGAGLVCRHGQCSSRSMPCILYGEALALSYSNPPDIPLVLKRLRQAEAHNPSIPYIHQTLGWAYEQQERLFRTIRQFDRQNPGISYCLRPQ
ncbi:MAG: hypothetical protein R3B83_02635 [Nitrospirales bacterium]|nr:hypothetical protein [Nitrospirales bacterium]